jgi:hypothetical protein
MQQIWGYVGTEIITRDKLEASHVQYDCLALAELRFCHLGINFIK